MNNELEFVINKSSKWWAIEKDLNGSFIWSSPSASIKINNKDIKSISLIIEYHQLACHDITVKTGDVEKLIILNDGINTVQIECSYLCLVSIFTNPYVPSKVDSRSFDERPLGIKLRGITIHYNETYHSTLAIANALFSYDLGNYSCLISKLNANGVLMDVSSSLSFPSIIEPQKTAIFLYIERPYKTIFETLQKYKIGNNYNLIVMSDNPEVYNKDESIIRLDNCQISHPNSGYRKTYAAAKGFINAIEISKSRNIDIFFWLEWDCLVNRDFWFDTLLDEHLSWKSGAIVSGTPIATPTIHNTVKEGYNLHYMMQSYTSEYIKECKVAMGNIPQPRNSMFFINGGLSFYKTSEMGEYFDNYTLESMRMGFDVYIGNRAFLKYREKVFEKCGWLKSSFSGGNPYFIYTHEQRMTMLNSGLKVAIHPYKVF